ncbi:hypothetical protein PPYR_10192 [Photinus pyralis]|uniref:Major facilitator superfamily (MFS) profile domain-containing protein n=1 Tax=Photinus pyralis TaxID=7054 RepID=A0A5N4AFP0_PHOPY|nr:facilitated trehalose transporter Tret1-like [Photinus pyralis]XP_031348118.1 facilitated trehalose transporter Tret1-like [Photinus pyralis]XP_031348119.1 facilitated trehalose transporter Tret1-like [Photinus pyralis]XP_031348120.1 facilitated trehalose transporter Tret1-like [Photinus pyralis]KAB0796131.1 hypothetical protein PPYR_10192 [Photinus pyralis]
MNLYLLPQIASALAVSMFCFLNGMELSYLSILIPYFSKVNGMRVDNSFTISDNQKSWLLSTGALIRPISNAVTGLVMDQIGRLNTQRFAILPWSIGWLIIATASNFPMLMAGFCIAISACPGFMISTLTYITEISSPSARGVLLSFKGIFWGLGSMSVFLLGAFIHWRTIAWINCLLPLIPFVLTLFVKESMLWLVGKGRIDDAKESLVYFNRYRMLKDENLESVIDRKLLSIQTLQERYQPSNLNLLQKMKFFLQPSGYKRVLMIAGLQVFNELTGSTVVYSNTILFFNEFSTTINPYSIGIYMGLARLATSFFSMWLLKTFKFRWILIVNYIILSGCLLSFGLYIDLNNKGTSINEWIPLCTMLLYTYALAAGPYLVAIVITPSIYPTHLRGTGQSISYIVGTLTEFSTIQSYYAVKKVVKQSHILYFMALSSLTACAYIYSCVVETYKKSFSEIEDYFSEKDNRNKNNPSSVE